MQINVCVCLGVLLKVLKEHCIKGTGPVTTEAMGWVEGVDTGVSQQVMRGGRKEWHCVKGWMYLYLYLSVCVCSSSERFALCPPQPVLCMQVD